jgi:hypothetical protein
LSKRSAGTWFTGFTGTKVKYFTSAQDAMRFFASVAALNRAATELQYAFLCRAPRLIVEALSQVL